MHKEHLMVNTAFKLYCLNKTYKHEFLLWDQPIKVKGREKNITCLLFPRYVSVTHMVSLKLYHWLWLCAIKTVSDQLHKFFFRTFSPSLVLYEHYMFLWWNLKSSLLSIFCWQMYLKIKMCWKNTVIEKWSLSGAGKSNFRKKNHCIGRNYNHSLASFLFFRPYIPSLFSYLTFQLWQSPSTSSKSTCCVDFRLNMTRKNSSSTSSNSINVWRINLDNHDIKRLTVKSWYYCHWLHCIQVLSLLYPFWLGKQYGSFLLFYVLSSNHYVLPTKNVQVQSIPVHLMCNWCLPFLVLSFPLFMLFYILCSHCNSAALHF